MYVTLKVVVIPSSVFSFSISSSVYFAHHFLFLFLVLCVANSDVLCYASAVWCYASRVKWCAGVQASLVSCIQYVAGRERRKRERASLVFAYI